MNPVPIYHPIQNSLVHNVEQLNDDESNHEILDVIDKIDHEMVVEPVQIILEDIHDDIDYWSSSIICYVFGANPPIQVMDRLCRRIQRSLNVDKAAMIKKGVFLVRFQAMDSRDKVLDGHYFFDKKPLILKSWSPDVDFEQEDVKTLPIWVQLKIALKYWGEHSLQNIVSQLGDPIKRDVATRNREKMQYAHILVENKAEQELIEFVYFINEHDIKVSVPVQYEWRPIRCDHCKNFGNEAKVCKLKKVRQTWRPKQVAPVVQKDLNERLQMEVQSQEQIKKPGGKKLQ